MRHVSGSHALLAGPYHWRSEFHCSDSAVFLHHIMMLLNTFTPKQYFLLVSFFVRILHGVHTAPSHMGLTYPAPTKGNPWLGPTQ